MCTHAESEGVADRMFSSLVEGVVSDDRERTSEMYSGTGMTTNFYAPPSAIRSGRVVLPEAEARHACSVLRAQSGDEMTVVDGDGGWYRVKITHAAPEKVVGTVVETRREVGEPTVDVTVGMGLLTKRSRFETFVEKAVELGVRRIVPLQTRHAETDSIRRDRLQNVMVAAMKQCRRSRLPALATPQVPASLVEDTTAANRRVLCDGGTDAVPLRQVMEGLETGDAVLALVGPEGGFADAEVTAAVEAGCTPVTLGGRRLRAETAGIAVVQGAIMTAAA